VHDFANFGGCAAILFRVRKGYYQSVMADWIAQWVVFWNEKSTLPPSFLKLPPHHKQTHVVHILFTVAVRDTETERTLHMWAGKSDDQFEPCFFELCRRL